MLRAETNEPGDARTTATALVGVLTALAADRPLLVAIDDVQWLDPASARALEFAVRRLPPRLGLLLTRRAEAAGEAPLDLGHALPHDRLDICVCGPLAPAALHDLITSRLGTSPARPTLVRIAEACGGNPFFALEIARALARDGDERRLGDPLPVRPSLARLRRLRHGVPLAPPTAASAPRGGGCRSRGAGPSSGVEHDQGGCGDRGQDRGSRAASGDATVLLDPKRALEHAEAAEQRLSQEREPRLVAWVLINQFLAEALLGRGPRRALLERGLELEARAGPAAQKHPVPVIWFDSTDEFDAARARHAIEDAWYRDRGDERTRAERLGYLVLAELRAGRWDLAERYANQSCAAIEQLDASGPYALAFGWRSLVDAHRGRTERARSTLQPLIEAAEQTKAAWWLAHLLSTLGFVEFAAGNHEASDQALRQMRERFDSIGVVDGLLDRSEPFHVESLLALGERDRAWEALQRLEECGRTLPRRWIRVTHPRARALLLAADGDPAAALAALDELDAAAATVLPFELGWALLVKGRLLRRLKQRRSAAEVLGEALAIFDRLGAPTWAQQARSELARVGPRRRSPNDLTATELRVAELTAAGLTNREVAKAAFMSPKTVEANLARIYRKLGIRSRAELGARMRDQVRPTAPRT